MENIRCKTCGGTVSRLNNSYVCDFCHNRWIVDAADDIQAVDRANAWAALRDGDFEKASQLFENIIIKDPQGHEAYWGRALSRNAIVYVTDLNENKKVPTCNNITEESFTNDVDVKKAISLAPNDIKEGYVQQSEQIEKIRLEWLEKARKEPAYDVFISYKDSDRDNGIERTQDSIDAQDLYNALVNEGYKVFFSRISLRDKISEQYEPYIYNAIKTAKVMIVFGERASYFNSTWIKNEWSRFKTRIEKGEKHKNSLVVAYKGFDPNELPVVLKSRQCLNAGEMTFLSSLIKHIGRVIEQSPDTVRLDRIKIENVKIEKKTAKLSNATIQTREIGQGAIAEVDISEQQTLSLIQTYIKASQWKEADSIIEDALFNNPSLAEALWCKLLVKYNAISTNNLLLESEHFTSEDYALIEKVLNCASQNYAKKLLTELYIPSNVFSAYSKILATVLPYNFDSREECINGAFAFSINNSQFSAFNLLLNTLKSDDTEKYIEYNFDYSSKTQNLSEKAICMDNILAIDEGNVNAYRILYDIAIKKNESAERLTTLFESILKYSDTSDDVVKNEVKYVLNTLPLSCKAQCMFAKQALRYYPDKLDTLNEILIQLCFISLRNEFFEDAEYFATLVLSFNKSSANAYLALCLVSIKAKSENDIVNSDIPIKKCAEFNKYLTLVDENRRLDLITLASKQENAIKNRRETIINTFDNDISTLSSNLDIAKKEANYIKKETINSTIRRFQIDSMFTIWLVAIILGITGAQIEDEVPVGMIIFFASFGLLYVYSFTCFGKEGFSGGVIAASIMTPAFIPITFYYLYVIKNASIKNVNNAMSRVGFKTVGELNSYISTIEVAINALITRRNNFIASN